VIGAIRRLFPRPTPADLSALVLLAGVVAAVFYYHLVRSFIGNAELNSALNPITPILEYATYPLSLLLLGCGLWRFRSHGVFAIPLAGSSVSAASMLFEVTWHLFGVFSPGFEYPVVNLEGYVLLGTFSAYGCVTLFAWRRAIPAVAGLAALVATFACWFVLGYPQLVSGSLLAFEMNWVAKVEAYLVVILLLLRMDLSPLGPWKSSTSASTTPAPRGQFLEPRI